ncbi:MAG: cell envelope integrity protein CreD [Helicobacteraceae bacterium]|jgi:inner membrane protein|nr:cell envelope integrity protein CreD [Helicobacteraceae bacterium]
MAVKFGKSALFTLKALGVTAMIIFMTLPLSIVEDTIDDRSDYKATAQSKITNSWGGQITVTPPALYVPFAAKETQTYENGRTVTKDRVYYSIYYPKEANAHIRVTTQIRNIGIFKVPVFTADITIEGSFGAVPLVKNAKPAEAFAEIALSGPSGVRSFSAFETLFNGEKRTPKFINNTEADKSFECVYQECAKSLLVAMPIDDNLPNDFKITAVIKGSDALHYIPVADKNTIQIVSDWKDPSFSGAYLPDEKTINDQGFDATWNIANIVLIPDPRQLKFTTSFITPIDNYRNALRGAKYGSLFILMTFALFFAFEVAGKKSIHPIQYLLIGFAMVIFYSLLVSFSEFIDFAVSYLIAAAATITLIIAYIKFGVFKNIRAKQLGFVTLSFAFLYGYLYVLLQLQDMALLYGSIGLFAALAIVMFVTRNIGWYEEQTAA